MLILLETTSFGSDQATFVVGVEGLSISGSATFDATADGVFAGLFDGSTVAFDYRPNNTSSGSKIHWKCSCHKLHN